MTEHGSKIDTLAVHAGAEPDPETGAVMPPIILASTFAQESPGKHRGFEYARTGNPTRARLERSVAALEGGAHGIAFASGCAAMSALFQTLRPGDHIVSSDDVYGGTFRILDKVMKPMGIETSWTDLTDMGALEAAVRPETKLIWIETPTNPLLKVVDIEAVAAFGKKRGVPVAVDNTFATPVLQRPLDLGADLVLHSTTKYINGHSDVVGGVAVTNDDALIERLHFLQNSLGGVPSPMDCYLTLRGIKTLPLRVRHQSATAEELARWLEGRTEVEKVIYPGLPNHPQHDLCRRQMKGFGAMISFVVRGGLAGARQLLERVRLFTLAESLGAVESLIEHPGIMTHASVPQDIREKMGIEDGLVRLSVGLEAVDDLRADLAEALSGC